MRWKRTIRKPKVDYVRESERRKIQGNMATSTSVLSKERAELWVHFDKWFSTIQRPKLLINNRRPTGRLLGSAQSACGSLKVHRVRVGLPVDAAIPTGGAKGFDPFRVLM